MDEVIVNMSLIFAETRYVQRLTHQKNDKKLPTEMVCVPSKFDAFFGWIKRFLRPRIRKSRECQYLSREQDERKSFVIVDFY